MPGWLPRQQTFTVSVLESGIRGFPSPWGPGARRGAGLGAPRPLLSTCTALWCSSGSLSMGTPVMLEQGHPLT